MRSVSLCVQGGAAKAGNISIVELTSLPEDRIDKPETG